MEPARTMPRDRVVNGMLARGTTLHRRTLSTLTVSQSHGKRFMTPPWQNEQGVGGVVQSATGPRGNKMILALHLFRTFPRI